jgi:chromosome partitioning protein
MNTSLSAFRRSPKLAGVPRPQSATGEHASPISHTSSRARGGSCIHRDPIRAWLRKRRVPMATVISMINLKGGVGKTTTTVAVAQMMDAEFGKRVLVIDLDPQTNATVMLIGDKKWGALNAKGHTGRPCLPGRASILTTSSSTFKPRSSGASVGALNDVRRLSLLPSSLDLIELQERLGRLWIAVGSTQRIQLKFCDGPSSPSSTNSMSCSSTARQASALSHSTASASRTAT